MTTIRDVTPPTIYNYYELEGVQETASPSDHSMCFIGRHNQVVSAFDSAGQVLESAKAGSLSNMHRVWRRALVLEGTRYDLPGVKPSAVVESKDVSVFAVLGSGTSRTIDDIRTAGDEITVFTGTVPSVTVNGDGNLVISDPIRNFSSLLQAEGYPTQDSGTSGFIATASELVVRFSGYGNDIPVLGVASTAIETAAASGAFTSGQTYSLVYKPAVARIESGAQYGRVLLSGMNRPQLGATATNFSVRLSSWTSNSLLFTDGAGSDITGLFYTTVDPAEFDTVNVVFATGSSGTGPSASISESGSTVTVTITLDDTDPGAGAYGDCTMDALNSALLTAASSDFPPIFFDGGNANGSFDPATYFVKVDAGPVLTLNSVSTSVDGSTETALSVSSVQYASILNLLPYVPFLADLEDATEQYDINFSWTGSTTTTDGTDVAFNPSATDWWSDRTSPLEVEETVDSAGLPVTKFSGGDTTNLTGQQVLQAMSGEVESGNPTDGDYVWTDEAFSFAQDPVAVDQASTWRAMPRYSTTISSGAFPYLYYADSSDDSMKPVDLSSRDALMPANEQVWYCDLRSTQPGIGGNGATVKFAFDTEQTDPVELSYSEAARELTITLRSNQAGHTRTSAGAVTLDDLRLALTANPGIPFEIANVYQQANDVITSVAEADYDTLDVDGYGLLSPLNMRRYSAAAGSVVDYGEYNLPGSTSAATRFGSSAPSLVVETPFFSAESDSWQALEAVSFDLYTSYKALRTDTSAVATVTNHGRRAELLEVTRSTYKAVLGNPSTDNPLALAAQQYFEKNGADRIVYFLGIDEISDAQPHGTDAAVTRALDLVKGRTPYHVFVVNDSSSMSTLLSQYADSLGGLVDETEASSELSLTPRPRGMFLYTATTNPEASLPIEKASGALTSKAVDGETTVVTSSEVLTNFSSAPRLFVVFPNFVNAGPVTLTDGRTAWPVSYAGDVAQISGVTLLVDAALPVFIEDDEPFILVQNGRSLRNADGTYDSVTALSDLREFHSQENFHARGLQKLHLDAYKTTFNGFRQRVDGLFLLGQHAAIISWHRKFDPINSLEYADAVEIEGTTDLYTKSGQLASLIGCGLTIPRAKGSSLTAAECTRDVSSHTFATNDDTHRLFMRRTALVTDDLFQRAVNARTRRILGPNKVNDEVLGLAGDQVEQVVKQYRREYKVLRLESIVEIDATIRARFGINGSGIYYRTVRRHQEEFTDVINQNVVLVGPEDPVS